MILLRLLNGQGIAGLAAALCLAALLVVQKFETRHWRNQSGKYEQLYRSEQAAFAGTVANYRAAAEAARNADKAAAERARSEQQAISERSNNALETRLADARARAANMLSGRVRLQSRPAADPGARGATSMPGLPAAPGSAAQAAGQAGLPDADALIATEQAIQLDELIKWVRAQAKVDNGPTAVTSSPGD